jgi:hypothetical protein
MRRIRGHVCLVCFASSSALLKIRPSALRKPFACQRASWGHRWVEGSQIVATLSRAYHALLHDATKYTGSRIWRELNVMSPLSGFEISYLASHLRFPASIHAACHASAKAARHHHPSSATATASLAAGPHRVQRIFLSMLELAKKVIGSLTEREPPSRRKVRVPKCS